MPPREGIYGLLAEFNTPSELVYATEQARHAGYRRMECYTPYPVEEAAEALHFHTTRVPLVCLLGGLMGVTTAFLMETWINVWAYPLNIAGRPLFSWPAFIIPWSLSSVWDVGAEWPAAALSSCLQRAQLQKRRHHRQVLPLSGGSRSYVFARRNTDVP